MSCARGGAPSKYSASIEMPCLAHADCRWGASRSPVDSTICSSSPCSAARSAASRITSRQPGFRPRTMWR
eukprot:2977132-Prymnesium_polylepis.2